MTAAPDREPYSQGGYVPPAPTIRNDTRHAEPVALPFPVDRTRGAALAEATLSRLPLRGRLAAAWRIIRARPARTECYR